jgi:Tol biopolymer transport system component
MGKESKMTKEKWIAYSCMNKAYGSMAIPNQNKFTFISRATGIPQVWTWNEANATAESFTLLPDCVLDVCHSPSGSYTILGMDNQGDERQQLFLFSQGEQLLKELTMSKEHFHHFGAWSPCESKIAWTSNRRK